MIFRKLNAKIITKFIITFVSNSTLTLRQIRYEYVIHEKAYMKGIH